MTFGEGGGERGGMGFGWGGIRGRVEGESLGYGGKGATRVGTGGRDVGRCGC